MNPGVAAGRLDGQIGRPRRHIQKAERLEKPHLPDGETAPGDIPAKAEEVIQKIVPPGDRGKDIPDHSDVLVAADSGHRGIVLPV